MGITQDFFLLALQGAWTSDALVFAPFPPVYMSSLPVLSGTESVDHQRVKYLSLTQIFMGC